MPHPIAFPDTATMPLLALLRLLRPRRPRPARGDIARLDDRMLRDIGLPGRPVPPLRPGLLP